MAWTFGWLRTWEDVWSDRNLSDWLAPFADGGEALVTPFMHPDFARAWLEAMGGEDLFDPYFLHASDGAGQRAMWLLVRPKPRWWRGHLLSLAPVGSPSPPFGDRAKLAAYYEPVFTAGAPESGAAAAFWSAFRVELDGMAGTSFDNFALTRFRVQCVGEPEGSRPYAIAPYLSLSPYETAEAYLAARSARVRGSIRRRLRNIEAAGRVAFHVTPPDDLAGALAWLPRMEAERTGRHGARPAPPGFLPAMVRRGLGRGLVHCSTLTLDDRPISWKFGYLLKGVYHGYYRAFDPAFAHLSPGSVHFFRLVDWMLAHGGEMIDFGIGDHAYKREWTDGEAWEVRGLHVDSPAPISLARRSAAATLREAQGLARRLGVAASPARALPRRRSAEPEAPPPVAAGADVS